MRKVTFLPWPPMSSGMWSRPLVAGELIPFSTQAWRPLKVKWGSSRRVMRLMISKCSSSIAIRSGRSGKGWPKAVASLTLKPAPRPRMSRPPLTASIVPAALAVMAGLRKVELTTVKPISTRGTTAAIEAARVTQSKTGARSFHLDRTCSPSQIESKPRRSASRAISRTRSQARNGSQPSNSSK